MNSKLKEYRVRIELDVDTIDLAYMLVKAPNEEEAIKAAIASYNGEDFDHSDLDRWESDGTESRLRTSSKDDWEVEEIVKIE